MHTAFMCTEAYISQINPITSIDTKPMGSKKASQSSSLAFGLFFCQYLTAGNMKMISPMTSAAYPNFSQSISLEFSHC